MNLKVVLASAIFTGIIGGAAATYLNRPSDNSPTTTPVVTSQPATENKATAQAVKPTQKAPQPQVTAPTPAPPPAATPQTQQDNQSNTYVQTPAVTPSNPTEPGPQNKPDVMSTLVIPGKQFGAITSKVSHADLVAMYGRNKLEETITYGPEGMGQWPATIVNMGPGQKVKVTWDDTSRIKATRASTIGDSGTWQTARGLKIGLPLSAMHKILGKFEITGFEWDYGNQVLLKNSPELQGLSMTVKASQENIQQYQSDYQKVMGDQIIASSDPRWKNLDIRIGGLEVYFQ